MKDDKKIAADALKAQIDQGAEVPGLYAFVSRFSSDQELKSKALALQNVYVLTREADKMELLQEYVKIIDHIVAVTDMDINTDDPDEQMAEQHAKENYHRLKAKSQIVVSINEVSKTYKNSGFSLKPLSADFFSGEITGIIGANGTGKSTLLRIIAGDLIPSSGKVEYPVLQKNGKTQPWHTIKNHVAYIPQDLPEWKGHLRQNLIYEAASHGIQGEHCDVEVDFMLERLVLAEEARTKHWHELSGGFKMRFALARALVWHPALLVLDEPLAHLDVVSQLVFLDDLRHIIRNFRRPICVIMTTQHIHEVESIADQLLLLDQGEMKYFGKPEEFDSNNLFNTFEFGTNLDELDLRLRLPIELSQSLKNWGYFYTVRPPVTMETNAFLQTLNHANIPVSYFRNVTHSLKKAFYDRK